MVDTVSFITEQRICSQYLYDPTFYKPGEVVAWFGAVQAQDFAAAKWALGLRMKNPKEQDIEQDFNDGLLLRTHLLRSTWHFVHPNDIRWMLALTAPRIHAYNEYYYHKSGLDKTIFLKSSGVIRNVLNGGNQLTRNELDIQLKKAKIPTQNLGLSYIIMNAEVDGLICSGPRRGKQFTYMLLDERVQKTTDLTYYEALTELTKRYFQSHGPAQIQDFAWWSGLTIRDVKKGIALAKLDKEIVNDKTYWFVKSGNSKKHSGINTHLLPPFDEYFVAYKDRSDILHNSYKKEMNFGGGMISGAIVHNGQVRGTWKRTFEKSGVTVFLKPFSKLTETERKAIEKAADKYGTFLNMPVRLC